MFMNMNENDSHLYQSAKAGNTAGTKKAGNTARPEKLGTPPDHGGSLTKGVVMSNSEVGSVCESEKIKLQLLDALKLARSEIASFPRSFGYYVTSLPKIDAAIKSADSSWEPLRVEKDKIPKRHKIHDFDKGLQDLMRSWSVHELAGSGCGPRGILGNGYHKQFMA